MSLSSPTYTSFAGNTGYLTRRGIAVCGTVLAIEVLDFLLRYDVDPTQPRQLSIVGHSFGGLIARYSLVLLQHILSALCITPVSFATLCTPHLGSRRPGGGMWKVYSFATSVGLDCACEPYSVLERMSHPDSPFVAALKRFRHRTLVGLIHGDHLVPHASSCLTTVVPDVPRVEPAQSWQWTLVHSGIDKGDATLGGFAQVNLVEMEASSTRQFTADCVEFDVQYVRQTPCGVG
ncbi:hypothetical protein DYB34_006472 [Aphanomyces astaci]|uniref:DUF676 domain-containing protein n=1 Tax=Aphanomyces astaci TaxID=112090 RepID=A0A3R6YQS4_APHAT|nr:hypothetical protein DYB34_006472 [Aphanomyces astaci]